MTKRQIEYGYGHPLDEQIYILLSNNICMGLVSSICPFGDGPFSISDSLLERAHENDLQNSRGYALETN